MSATPGKVVVDGIARVGGQEAFVLRFIQARNPDWVGRPFFARFDPEAVWLDELEPLAPDTEHFYDPELRAMLANGDGGVNAIERRRPAIFGRVDLQ
jgi:hypothetical protein